MRQPFFQAQTVITQHFHLMRKLFDFSAAHNGCVLFGQVLGHTGRQLPGSDQLPLSQMLRKLEAATSQHIAQYLLQIMLDIPPQVAKHEAQGLSQIRRARNGC